MGAIQQLRHKITPEWARKWFYNYLSHKEYLRVMGLPKQEYESYLVDRYREMMNRIPYTAGAELDLSNPLTYTQKQQWLKLYDQDDRKAVYSDKYAVRKHVEMTIGKDYLIPLISIDGKDHFSNADEIDFEKLPNQFVIKCNHGSHYNIIVKDKSKLSKRDISKYKKQLNYWLNEHYAFLVGLELVYQKIKPCIIIEKYMAIDDDLPDYKFMCFSGEPKLVWVDQGRFTDHRRTLFNLNYEKMPYNMYIHEDILDMKKPDNFNEMVKIAKALCEDFPYVRVDLYSIGGKVYFGELTFCSGAGFQAPNPLQYDRELGDMIKIDNNKREGDYTYRHK